MSHRTQITLTDEQYARLREEARRSGHGLAELVRRAVERSWAVSRCRRPERPGRELRILG
ncbi:MAG: ribbon-helix-helix protein, CopG family [Gammaproteobacteria bacterium]|nr:ribbon-helix-helix protein, CopG family [Gammaproteobacteria bacterium]